MFTFGAPVWARTWSIFASRMLELKPALLRQSNANGKRLTFSWYPWLSR
jgi:hypothetical protein